MVRKKEEDVRSIVRKREEREKGGEAMVRKREEMEEGKGWREKER